MMADLNPDTTAEGPVLDLGGVLGLGCWAFGGTHWAGQDDAASLATMRCAFKLGVRHFDTARLYGEGRSEQLLGRFLAELGERDKVFLASKELTQDDPATFATSIDQSLKTLGTDWIDLYYIHWPKAGVDLRPTMEVLEKARSQGKIRAIGVSNFSVAQMEQMRSVGKLDVCQLCYNLLWRFGEKDVIPYCLEHGVALVSYSSIAQGILTGKFPAQPMFKGGDLRPKTVLFDAKNWPYVFHAVERLKPLAIQAGRPLGHLAIQWVQAQPGVQTVLVGARDTQQMHENAAAILDPVDPAILELMTDISNDALEHIEDEGNLFRFYP